MSFIWEITETGTEKTADGEYLAALKSVEEKINEFGSYIQIAEQLDGGKMRYEKFHVGHSDEKKRERAIKSFNLFCFDLTGKPLGTKVEENELLSKKYILTIKNIMFDNGNVWEKAVSRVRVEAPALNEAIAFVAPVSSTIMPQPQNTVQYGAIGIPQQPVVSNQPLNDDVPF